MADKKNGPYEKEKFERSEGPWEEVIDGGADTMEFINQCATKAIHFITEKKTLNDGDLRALFRLMVLCAESNRDFQLY